MSYYIDAKYINLVSHKLERFAWKRQNVAACRCPICGDSKKNLTKTRFFFFQEDCGKYFVKCHNCGYSTTFQNFLKDFDDPLFREYKIESIKDKYSKDSAKEVYTTLMETVRKSQDTIKHELYSLKECTRVDQLPDDHPTKIYVSERKIPKDKWNLLYHSDDFFAAATENLGYAGGDMSRREVRLVIPFFLPDGTLFALQGRALDPNEHLRYRTLRDPKYKNTKMYGLERLNPAIRNYCLEGPIDSLFLPNAVAMAGSLVNTGEMGFDTTNTVFVYDNEPRNKEIVNTMAETAQKGFKICVFPKEIHQKDINDMVKDYIDVKTLVDGCTYQGLSAILAIKTWKSC